MKISRSPVRLRFSMGYALVVGIAVPALVFLFLDTRHQRWAIAVVAAGAVLALVTFRGRRLTGWVQTLFGWIWRRRRAPETASKAAVGATVLPGDPVAVRWRGETLVALIELIARPFTPTVIVDGQARSEDVLDTAMLEQLLAVRRCRIRSDGVVVHAQHFGGCDRTDPVPGGDHVGLEVRAVHRQQLLQHRGVQHVLASGLTSRPTWSPPGTGSVRSHPRTC